MKIKYYESHNLGGYAFVSEIEHDGVWDSTIYINSKFCWIGKAVNLFHELFHWLLRWIEVKQDHYIFPYQLDDFWDALWFLKIKESLSSLRGAGVLLCSPSWYGANGRVSEKLDIDIDMTYQSKTMRDKLSVILGLVSRMEKEKRMAEKARLLERLQTEHDIRSSEAERLIEQMLGEGILFSPKNRYLRKT